MKKDVEPEPKEFNPVYSFWVGGHTYGNPNSFQYGLYPPLMQQITFIDTFPNMRLGILTGDVVPASTQAYWDSALVDINNFSMPIYIAPGNHDRGPNFDALYASYHSFIQNNDLFIILSPTNWNIEGVQKTFLETTIQNNQGVDNIFIFLHELIWWSPVNKFSNVEINYRPHYPGSTNYWSEIHPYLDTLPTPVTIFAGDLGATSVVTPYMYYQESNVTLIGSGMGGGLEDNIIIVEVDLEGTLKMNLIDITNPTPFVVEDFINYELP